MNFKTIKYAAESRWLRLRETLSPTKMRSGADIPIVINNFNRLTTLRRLVGSLEKRGLTNIHILDNGSTYPPLLEWYGQCPYEVIMLQRNLGFKALWKDRKLRRRFCRDYYIYTDSDVMLSDDCPEDVADRLFRLLRDKYRRAFKLGLALRVDNIPDGFRHKREVIAWESRYNSPANADGLHRAPTDTTFALYRPHAGLSRSRYAEAYRTVHPYAILHLPWYQDSANPDSEERYYRSHCTKETLWTSKQ